MYQYNFQLNNSQNVLVVLDTDDVNTRTLIEYQGQSQDILIIKKWLSLQTGVFGHILGDATTPMDLDFVMKYSEGCPAKIIKILGKNIDSYNNGLSQNSVT